MTTSPNNTFDPLLAEANDIINGIRQQSYGAPENSFVTIAAMWNDYRLGCMKDRLSFNDVDVAMMMILLKVARTNDMPTHDSLVDIAGYAALAQRLLDEE
jgi:hypothetical protein